MNHNRREAEANLVHVLFNSYHRNMNKRKMSVAQWRRGLAGLGSPATAVLLFIASQVIAFSQQEPTEEEYPPVKIRTLGVGDTSMRLASPGFDEGASVLLTGSRINGPLTYRGPLEMVLAEVNSSGERIGALQTLRLPEDLDQVLIVGISPPNGEARLFILPDDYGREDRRTISVLNVTTMDLFVKLGEETGRVEKGGVFRENFNISEDQKRLSISMVGARGAEKIPLVNSRLRIMPGRDLTLVVTGAEMSADPQFGRDQVDFSYVYHSPLIDRSDRTSSDTGGESVEIQIKGGDL